MIMRSRHRLTIGVVFLALLAGCGHVDLHHELSEGEAGEILVLLSNHDIDATKIKEIIQQRTTWKISVSARHVTRARELLIQHNLPRRRELGLAEVYKEKGLIPTPDEQKARFLLALKGEIINSLERIPGIVDADVVLNVPEAPVFGEDKAQRPTASVVIRIRPGGEPPREDKIQQFVANTVEHLDPRDVAVIISAIGGSAGLGSPPASTSSPTASATPPATTEKDQLVQVGGLKLDASSARRFKVYAASVLVVLILVSLGLVYVVFRLSRLKGGGEVMTGSLAEGVSGALPAGGASGGVPKGS